MDFNSIWLSGILGAVGGMLGVWVARRFENRLLRAALMVLPVALALQAGFWFSSRNNEPFDGMINEAAQEFRNNKSFMKAIHGMNEAEAHAFTEEKARAGLRRLSLEELREWNSLRLKMAVESPEICAGLWTGRGIDGEKIRAVLLKFPREDARRWIRTSMAAAILEIEQKPAPEVPPGAMTLGISKVMEKLSSEDRQRFSAILISSVMAEDKDACWAMTLLLKVSPELSKQDEESFLRALAGV